MTGQGQGRCQIGSAEITSEVRAVNNRHLKIHTRTSDGLSSLEPKIESLVRSHLRRGSLQLGVQVIGGRQAAKFSIDTNVIEDYLTQCKTLSTRLGLEDQDVSMADLLSLPGVVAEPKTDADIDDEVEGAVLEAVTKALNSLNEMRLSEGESMGRELKKQLEKLQSIVKQIDERAPTVIDEYKTRLSTKLSSALATVGAEIQEADLVREVLLMADKSDIREEVVRLQSHFVQFAQMLDADESQGRKLDFLIQEMFREVNTIGSKAGDATIAQRVVDMKAVIEQMRELVQNVE